MHVIKDSSRFKTRGLQSEDNLATMFEDLRNADADHWSASNGLPPSQPNVDHSSTYVDVDFESNYSSFIRSFIQLFIVFLIVHLTIHRSLI